MNKRIRCEKIGEGRRQSNWYPDFYQFYNNTQTSKTEDIRAIKGLYYDILDFDAQLTLRGNTIYYLIFSGKEFQKMSFKILN